MNLRLLLVAAALPVLTGCGVGMSDLEDYAEEVKSRKSTDIEPIPQIIPYSPFLYDPAGRRDPFVALNLAPPPETVTTTVSPDLNRNREPLEEFPLDSLRMMGTIEMRGARYALVRGGDGIIHRVTVGNYMGQNYGKIVAINEAEVQLVELIPDGFSGYMEQPASIALSD